MRIKDIRADFGISESCLQSWFTQADRDDGVRSEPTTDEQAENRELRRRVRLLKQENEVLRRAAAVTSSPCGVRRVAAHRQATIEPLADVLAGFGGEAQTRWWRWRRKLRLEETTPETFDELLAQVVAFADPVLLGEASGHIWNPAYRSWQ